MIRFVIFSALIIITLPLVKHASAQSITIGAQCGTGGASFEILNQVKTLSDGSVIAVGQTSSNQTGNLTDPLLGAVDGLVVKYDGNLNVLWDKTFGGDTVDAITDILPTQDGGAWIVGASNSSVSGDRNTNIYGMDDYWLLKIDASGNIESQYAYGGNQGDGGAKLDTLSNGDIIIAGTSKSGLSGVKSENSRGQSDFWVLRVDVSGNIIWDKTLGGDANDDLQGIAIDDLDNIYLSGWTESSQSGDKTDPSYGNSDLWVVKLNSSGSIVWDKTLGGNSLEKSGTCVLYDGVLYVLGESDSGPSGNKTSTNIGLSDYWLIKLNIANGSIQDDYTFGGASYDIPSSIDFDGYGRLIMCGTSDSGISGDKTEASYGAADYWVISTDSAGAVYWDKSIGGSSVDEGRAICKLGNSSFVVGGFSTSSISGSKTVTNYGINDFWLTILETNLSSSTLLNELIKISVYPNPSNSTVTIEFDALSSNATLTITDMTGKLIFTDQLMEGTSQYNLKVTGFSAGSYFYSIVDKNGAKTTKKLQVSAH